MLFSEWKKEYYKNQQCLTKKEVIKWLECHKISNEIIKTILYKPNRVVVFPAKNMHYVNAPNRFVTDLRLSLAYKFLEVI